MLNMHVCMNVCTHVTAYRFYNNVAAAAAAAAASTTNLTSLWQRQDRQFDCSNTTYKCANKYTHIHTITRLELK